MTSQPSEERNRLRLQAWEQRNQETGQVKEQTPHNVPLFGQPYKTNKGDELSSRIQRMLGCYEDNATTEPFAVSSPITFPLSNCIQPVHHKSTQSQKGPSANNSSTRPFNSPNYQHQDVSFNQSQGSQLIHSSLQKMSAFKDNVIHNEKQCSDHDDTEPPETQFHVFERPQHPTENTLNHINSMEVSSKDARTITTLHSQTFHPPLSYKQSNAAITQKPTAYVRPMDGLDQVVSESPELKPSPEHYTCIPELTPDKSTQGKTHSLPQFLETKASEVQCVEDILREMTCSWPPLLTGIHSPRSNLPPKSQSSVKLTEVEHPRQKNDQTPFTDPSHRHQSSSVLSEESSDPESSSKSESESESATDESAQPPLSTALNSQPAAVSRTPGDWQLDKLISFSQHNYRSKSQWASQSPKPLQPTDSLKCPSVNVLIPATDNATTPQQSNSQENHYQPSSHEALLSRNLSDQSKPIEDKPKGGVSVHFDRTSTIKEEPSLKERPKVKTDGRHRKQSKSVVFESKLVTKRNKKWSHSDVKPQVSLVHSDQSPSCVKPSNQGHLQSLSRSSHKKVTKLSEHKCLKKDYSQDCSKSTFSLVVKIDLSLLSRVPQVSGAHEKVCSISKKPSVVTQHCTKEDKPHKVVKNIRKKDKEDQSFPKKKTRLEGSNPTLDTVIPEIFNKSQLSERKKTKINQQLSHPSPATKDSAQKCSKHKHNSGNAQSNKEDMKSPNVSTPRKSSRKCSEQKHVQKPMRESLSNRPLLRLEDQHYPVKHYIKEAKRLKHKADAEMDKLSKIFNYLDAACYFIESGIAMERDPQISVSSSTMFAETVELIKFVLKLINIEDPSPTENDLLALCLKCQSLLQSALFHHKQKTALQYSKTLIDHFNSSSQPAPDPSAIIKGKHTAVSPANAVVSSGTAPSQCCSGPLNGHLGGTVVVPQDIGQMALTYVNITTLFLNAHDLWEQAEDFANKGSGLSAELDTAVGALCLTSTMRSMVCYTRQGLHWLRMDCQKVK